jgi:hypothetical protein
VTTFCRKPQGIDPSSKPKPSRENQLETTRELTADEEPLTGCQLGLTGGLTANEELIADDQKNQSERKKTTKSH